MKREDFILPVHAEERKRTKKNTESTFSNITRQKENFDEDSNR